ncbi:sensor histidine kinase [Paenibacillus roseipurpureus]|uniref:histidine kinase n=1 Tax=Paenibacillus roseopurpureus TaxID=2918901 RepID=A0AA96LQ04_9BACL|nr:histidine kinase [Paenibacillus sp. MBLB1832]WNR46142.1 histidine kinase [Paenibacillus sp. MBLB1832]
MSALIPLLLLGLTSYYTIYMLLENKVERGIRNSLEVERLNVENLISNLDFASKQLVYGSIGSRINSYLSSSSYDQYEFTKNITESLETTTYTNPLIGTMFYYLPATGEELFNFFQLKNINPLQFDELGSGQDVAYYAPHPPMNVIETKPLVLSITRKLKLSDGDKKREVYAYLETTGAAYQGVFRNEQYGFNAVRALLSSEGKVVYSENMKLLPVGLTSDELSEKIGDSHYIFKDKGKQGWQIAVFVKKNEVNAEINQWIVSYSLIAFFSLTISLILAYALWRTIYRPLVNVKREIQLLSNNQWDSPVKKMGIREFDELLSNFMNMKLRITDLLQEVQEKEKKKKQLEIEKLLYQINPHFLYNTLNTIQWYGMMIGHKEIVTLAKAFSRVLHYNLGKEGTIVTVSAEIEALKDYIQLQQIRYNYNFQIDIEAQPETLTKNLPRFILQPLVENALYHAFKDDGGRILVRCVLLPDGFLQVTVEDNGQGISEDKLRTLFEEQSDSSKRGMGIGLSFVNNQLKSHYGETYGLQVTSTLGEGTVMIIRVPSEIKEEQSHDRSINRR